MATMDEFDIFEDATPPSASQNTSQDAPERPRGAEGTRVTREAPKTRQRRVQRRTRVVEEPSPADEEMDEYELQRWRTLIEADAGRYGRALKAAKRARAIWERTVAAARDANFPEGGIEAAAHRAGVTVPEED